MTARRLWVKLDYDYAGLSQPVAITVHPDEVFDDIKLKVMNKFPVSLAQHHDPSHISIGYYPERHHSPLPSTPAWTPRESVVERPPTERLGERPLNERLTSERLILERPSEKPMMERQLSERQTATPFTKKLRPTTPVAGEPVRNRSLSIDTSIGPVSPLNQRSNSFSNFQFPSKARPQSPENFQIVFMPDENIVDLLTRMFPTGMRAIDAFTVWVSGPGSPLIKEEPELEEESFTTSPETAMLLLPKGFEADESTVLDQLASHHHSFAEEDLSPLASTEDVTQKTSSTRDKVFPNISVLIVEDNMINQAILASYLRKHKIKYKLAKNGAEAVQKWKEGGLHLVLMDIQLPVMSGIEATQEIRRLEKANGIGVFNTPENHHASNVAASVAELKRGYPTTPTTPGGTTTASTIKYPIQRTSLKLDLPSSACNRVTEGLRSPRLRTDLPMPSKEPVQPSSPVTSSPLSALPTTPVPASSSSIEKETDLPEKDRVDKAKCKTPVIIVALTASTLQSDRAKALLAGCNDYLTKPVNLDWLGNKITEWGCMQALIDFDGWKAREAQT